MQGIKTFPNEIQEHFDKKGITYFDETKRHKMEYESEWDFFGRSDESGDKAWARKQGTEIYSDKLHRHWFSAQYFSIGVAVEFF